MLSIPSKRYWVVLAAMIVAAGVWVGGGAKDIERPEFETRGSRSTDAQIPPKSAPVIDRNALTQLLSDHPDHLIMLELWVASSIECVEGINDIIDVQRQFANERFMVISVNMGEHDRWRQVRRLLIEKGVNFPCHTTDFDGMLGVGEMMGASFVGEVPFRAFFRNGRMISHSGQVADHQQISNIINRQLEPRQG